MMAGLIGEHAAVIGPRSAPFILIVIGLIPAPAHAHRPKNKTAEPAGFQRLPRFDDRNIEAILFDDKQLDAGFVAGADHVVRILQPQRHRLFDNHMLSRPCTGDDMLGMHSTRRQDRNRVDLFLRQKVIDIVIGRHAELRRDRIGARANRIADSD